MKKHKGFQAIQKEISERPAPAKKKPKWGKK
jgi:hypothetical protein